MGSIPGLVQWVKDLPLPQLWRRSKLQLGFDPWPGGVAKKKKNLKKWSSKEWFQKCSVQVGEEWLLLRVFVSRADPEPED